MGISPKKAFEAIKILWPRTRNIKRVGSGGWKRIDAAGSLEDGGKLGETIDWGTVTEYPAPEPKWRDARPGDVRQRGIEARFRDFDSNPWDEGVLLGCDFSAEYAWKCKGVGQYKYCQVKDE